MLDLYNDIDQWSCRLSEESLTQSQILQFQCTADPVFFSLILTPLLSLFYIICTHNEGRDAKKWMEKEKRKIPNQSIAWTAVHRNCNIQYRLASWMTCLISYNDAVMVCTTNTPDCPMWCPPQRIVKKESTMRVYNTVHLTVLCGVHQRTVKKECVPWGCILYCSVVHTRTWLSCVVSTRGQWRKADDSTCIVTSQLACFSIVITYLRE